MRPTLLIALPFMLTACALTPRQACESPHRSELRIVRDEIRTTQTDLRRGFHLVPASWEYGIHYCLGPAGSISTCTRDDGKPMYDKQPINRAAESAKLAALHSEQARLEKAIAACALQYPE